jgi:quercetin dioxygenase-like cupin family protein
MPPQKSLIRALILAMFLLPVATAQAEPTGTGASSWRHDDPALQWGPCPEFLPAGCAIAVLQGDPAGPNADVFFKVPGGAEIAAHWHTSAERMVLVSGRMTVQYDGQPEVELERGSYAYGPARAVHSGRCAVGEDCVLFIAFELPVDAVPVDAVPVEPGEAVN